MKLWNFYYCFILVFFEVGDKEVIRISMVYLGSVIGIV